MNMDTLPALPVGELWVFGYGSLMWRPGFDYLEMHMARIYGYHRALCVWSWVHRGTRERPGLIFGLDIGGSCVGRVFRVAAQEKEKVVEYLYRREMVTPVYRPRLLTVYLPDRTVTALTFIIDRSHAQYAGKLMPEHAAAAVCRAQGQSGDNRDYLVNTLNHLQEVGINDHGLEQIRALVMASA